MWKFSLYNWHQDNEKKKSHSPHHHDVNIFCSSFDGIKPYEYDTIKSNECESLRV